MQQLDSLKLELWKQISSVEIDFHPKVTIVTGANGAGKTTISRILARQVGWGFNEVASPGEISKTGLAKYWSRFTSWKKNREKVEKLGNKIGSIVAEGKTINLTVPEQEKGNAAEYSITHTPTLQMKGIHIPSHRVPFQYVRLQTTPPGPISPENALNQFVNNTRSRVTGGGGHPTTKIFKETIISWAIYGYESKHIVPNPTYGNLFEQFQETLKKVLPSSLGFNELKVKPPEVVLSCDTGEFLVDACSGGISSLVDLTWQLFLCTRVSSKIVAIIDEAENHLHASMQRSLLPSLVKAFPDVQYIVTTHSPLIIGSVKDSNIYVLDFNENNLVGSTKLDFEGMAGDAVQVLHDVLGVPFTMPIWVEKELDEILKEYQKNPTADALSRIHEKLKAKGLAKAFPMLMTSKLEEALND